MALINDRARIHCGAVTVARWSKGAEVAWRSILADGIGTVLSGYIVEDSDIAQAIFQPTGAPRRRRTGDRGGPSGRNMLPGGWDGGHEEDPFHGPSVVRVHVPGSHFSVIRKWDSAQKTFHGWYINLEQPWVRTEIGFDSRDDILDIVASDDMSSWGWKDADELEWSVEVGKVSPADADAAYRAGRGAIERLESRRWPFDEAGWNRLMPSSDWGIPQMPNRWFAADSA